MKQHRQDRRANKRRINVPEIHRGPVHARHLRENVKLYGDKQGVIVTLELLLEEFSAQRTYIRQVTEHFNELLNMLNQQMIVTEGLRNAIIDVRRVMKQGDEQDGNV